MRIGVSKSLKSAKYLQQRRRKTIVTLVWYFIAIVLLFISIIIVLRLPFLQISNIEVNNNASLSENEIKQKALSSLNGNYLYFIPKTNTFFYSKKDIVANLLGSYKNVTNVDIQKNSLSSLDITISERVPDAIVCDGYKDEDTDGNASSSPSVKGEKNKCYLSDSNALLFTASTNFVSDLYTKYYVNSSSNDLAVGSPFMDSTKFKDLQKFILGVKDFGITVTGVLVDENNNYELYFLNNDKTNSVLYFDDRVPFEKTLSNLTTFLHGSTVKNFEYINLRFGNNVFYIAK